MLSTIIDIGEYAIRRCAPCKNISNTNKFDIRMQSLTYDLVIFNITFKLSFHINIIQWRACVAR